MFLTVFFFPLGPWLPQLQNRTGVDRQVVNPSSRQRGVSASLPGIYEEGNTLLGPPVLDPHCVEKTSTRPSRCVPMTAAALGTHRPKKKDVTHDHNLYFLGFGWQGAPLCSLCVGVSQPQKGIWKMPDNVPATLQDLLILLSWPTVAPSYEEMEVQWEGINPWKSCS